MQKVGAMGGQPLSMMALFITTIPFYALTMETYYIGQMNLPPWFGPDDTQVAVIIFYIFASFTTDSDFLYKPQEVPGFPGGVSFG